MCPVLELGEKIRGVFLKTFVSSFEDISEHLMFADQQQIFRPSYSGLVYTVGRAKFLWDRIKIRRHACSCDTWCSHGTSLKSWLEEN
jgi:hypothetical protein